MRGELALAISEMKQQEDLVRKLPKTESECRNTDPMDMLATITNIDAAMRRLVGNVKNSQFRDDSMIGLPRMVSEALSRIPVTSYQMCCRIAPIGFSFKFTRKSIRPARRKAIPVFTSAQENL